MKSNSPEFKYLGKPRKLVEGAEKVTGHVRYTADLTLPGMLYVHPILSPYAHANILEIDKSEAERMPGVIAVVVAHDLITKDRVIATRNSAILAKGKVHWRGQPVVAIVAATLAEAVDAADYVFIDYEPLTAVVDVLEAMNPDSPLVWPNGLPKPGTDLSSVHANVKKQAQEQAENKMPPNVFDQSQFSRGDISVGFKEADFTVERTYRTGMVHQCYLEPHACVADPDPLGRGLTLYTSTQGAYMVRDEVSELLSLPVSKVRVVPMAFGGGFGAKYGILEPLAGAIALKLKKPVRIVLSRSDDFVTTTPAHAMAIRLKTAVKNDGILTAVDADIYIDNGAFSFPIGGIGATLIGGYYKCPNVHINVHEINTNKPPAGAYRAPSAPQITFALESNIDDMARAIGMDQLDFRIKNAVETGDLDGTGNPWPPIGLKEVLTTLRDHPTWINRHTEENEGIGIAIGGWPAFMGPAGAICKVDTDGTVTIQSGAIDISGVNSTFVLVVAELLNVDPSQVEIITGDTQSGPFTPNSGGSQITYSVSGAIANAVDEAKQKLLQIAAQEFEASVEDIELENGHAQVVGVPDRKISLGKLVKIGRSQEGGVGPIVGEGSAAVPENAPGFVVNLAKVKIDPETGHVHPTQFLIVQDVGFALNPLMVEGQMTGGVVQAIGMGLQEMLVFDTEGQSLTGSFMDYALPRFDTVPNIETVMVEVPSPHGPFGARGIGEPPIIAGAAALVNAIRDATGIRVTELPVKNEMLWKRFTYSQGAAANESGKSGARLGSFLR